MGGLAGLCVVLSFTANNICEVRLNFVESSIDSSSHDIFALCETNMDDSN